MFKLNQPAICLKSVDIRSFYTFIHLSLYAHGKYQKEPKVPNKPIVLTAILLLVTPFLTHTQQVSPDGSFSYTYPIKLPPGTGGIQPNLALTYNSNSGNSICGLGWKLSGLPAITRDRTYDVNFDENDHYVYGGQRLIYSEVNGYFHTEKEGYLRIAAYDATENRTGPIADIAYWVVTQKNGTKMYFGHKSDDHTEDTDGHIDAVGKDGKALLWALSKVVDVHGNYYTIDYHEESDGDYYPVKITYTKGNGLSRFATVEFYYDDTRTDHCSKYVPTLMDLDKRLKWISIKFDNRLIRKYRIDYEEGTSTWRSRIIKIEEYGSEGNTPWYSTTRFPCISNSYVATGNVMPATNLEWQEGGDGTLQEWTDHREDYHEQCKRIPGDFNGDGITDVLFWNIEQGTLWIHPVVDGILQAQTEHLEGFNTHDTLYTGDFNGDNVTDVLFWSKSTGEIKIYPVRNGKLQDRTEDLESYHENSTLHPGDYDGDGTTDILFWNSDDGIIWIHPVINGILQDRTEHLTSWHENSELYPGDYNGNGITDILFWNPGNGIVWIHPVKNGKLKDWTTHETGWHEYSKLYPGDYNGDGVTDVLFWYSNDPKFYGHPLCPERGILWIHPVKEGVLQTHTEHLENYHDYSVLLPGDYNGDSVTDVLFWNETPGIVWLHPVINGKLKPRTEHSESWHEGSKLHTGNINGDCITDIYFANSDEIWIHPVSKKKPDILTSIVHETGTLVTISYKPAAQFPGAIDPAETTHPYISNSSSRYLVESVTINDGMGNESIKKYEYSNGMFYTGYRDDRRNIGFEWIKTTNHTTGSYILTEYYHKNDDPLFQGMVKRQTTCDMDDNKYKEILYTYDSRLELAESPAYHAVNFIFKKDDYIYNYDSTLTHDTYRIQYAFYDSAGEVTNYDAYGNFLKVRNHGDVTITNDDTEETTGYIVDETNYIMAPKLKKVDAYNLAGDWNEAKQTK